MTKSNAQALGYTRAISCDNWEYPMNLLVKPDTDFDSRFKAWDCDMQSFIWVNGWMIADIQEATH
jgi:hypothetical protein